MNDFPEPIFSICPDTWRIYADFLGDDCSDPEGEARARRIAQTLASGRTGLYLEWSDGTSPFGVSAAHYAISGEREVALAHDHNGSYRWLSRPEWHWGDYSLGGMEYQPISPAMLPELFKGRPDVARQFFDRLHDLGPLIWLTEDNPTVNVPASVAVCPECGGKLLGTIEGWTVGNATPFTVTLDCGYGDVRSEGWSAPERHRFRRADWQPVRDTVERWARDNVRVRVRQTAEEAS